MAWDCSHKLLVIVQCPCYFCEFLTYSNYQKYVYGKFTSNCWIFSKLVFLEITGIIPTGDKDYFHRLFACNYWDYSHKIVAAIACLFRHCTLICSV